MSKSLRLSEKWFRRGLWLVALAFAGFLIGLGGTIVGDLPQVERQLQLDDFIDKPVADPLRAEVRAATDRGEAAQRELEQAELQRQATQQASRNARETFSNWLATRRATQQPDQDTELIARTRALDALKSKEDESQQRVQAQRQVALDARQAQDRAQRQLSVLEEAAGEKLQAEYRRVELRVFLYRLALTLPLLVVAGWLFAKKRKSTWWPFVWGFILFAVFAFFVELVPYLPSYGGYVRYAVGIVVTVLVGRYAIVGLNRYLARQKLAEAHTRPGAARGTQLRRGTGTIGQERVPGLRAAGRPEEREDRLLPALRHRPVRSLPCVRRTQERLLEVLPRLRHHGAARCHDTIANTTAYTDGAGRVIQAPLTQQHLIESRIP